MKVLAIDPGYGRMGIALLARHESKDTLIYSDCFTTDAKESFPTRIRAIGDEITRLITHYRPDAIALEELFFNTNQKTAFRVAEARGAILYTAAAADMRIYEYTPLQVKIAVTGYGRSDKAAVTAMIRRLVTIEKKIQYDDEYDAIGIGLTHLASAAYVQRVPV